MNNPDYQQWRELAWRRELTEAERTEFYAAAPEATTDADAEVALSAALARLPDALVPSNFTALVLQAVARETRPPVPRHRDWAKVWRVLVPRTTLAAVIVGAGLLGYHRHQVVVAQRAAVGESMVTITGVQSLPSPQILADFDVIRRLDSTPPADQDLLALLQ